MNVGPIYMSNKAKIGLMGHMSKTSGQGRSGQKELPSQVFKCSDPWFWKLLDLVCWNCLYQRVRGWGVRGRGEGVCVCILGGKIYSGPPVTSRCAKVLNGLNGVPVPNQEYLLATWPPIGTLLTDLTKLATATQSCDSTSNSAPFIPCLAPNITCPTIARVL